MTVLGDDLGRFGRRAALIVALAVGQTYGLVLFATTWAEGALGWAFVATTELHIVTIALVAALVFGFVTRRRRLTNVAGVVVAGVLSVVAGRIAASFVLFAVTGAIALTKRPDAVGEYLAILVPGSLGFALVTAVLTLFVPEALGVASGLAILGILRGRFAELRGEPA